MLMIVVCNQIATPQEGHCVDLHLETPGISLSSPKNPEDNHHCFKNMLKFQNKGQTHPNLTLCLLFMNSTHLLFLS